MSVKDKAKQVVQKAKKTIEKIIKTIKFFATPLGTAVAWILFILFAVILLYVVVQTITVAFKDFFGFNTDYITYDADKETIMNFGASQKIVDELYQSGYSSQMNPNDFTNFKAFEYAVLMDAAEYIRVNGQEEFDVAKNQGIYLKERELLKDLIKEAEEEKAKSNPNGNREPVVKLLATECETDQSVIEGETLKSVIEQGSSTRNINAISATGQGNNAQKEVLGGNNRVMGPFLVYEFLYNSIGIEQNGTSNSGSAQEEGSRVEDLSGDTASGETVKNNREYLEESRTAEDLFDEKELGGSVIPYIYVVREEIDFSYYFNDKNEVLEIPLLLNSYNSDLEASTERSKEIMRATKGVAARVWPDRNMDKKNGDYTWVPYYSDETNCTIYKIPLKTIIGRYMPRLELLYAWSSLKSNITQGSDVIDNRQSIELGEEIVTKIKQIYNYVCLNGEQTQSKTKTQLNIKTEEYEEVPYEYDTSNYNSFVTFEKAGIETSRYLNFEDVGTEEIKYISDFVSAYTISEKVTLYTNTANEGELGIPINLSDLNVGAAKRDVLRADGSPEEGYVPISDLNNTESLYMIFGAKGSEETLKSRVLAEACAKNNVPNDGTAHIEISIEYSPIFIVSTAKYNKTLKIEHRRMPMLLVKSAITWAREIEYTHKIKQELFEQTDSSYIVPNCVSSMGIHSFITEETRSEYRGKAYEDILESLQEKDVISMLLTLEMSAEDGVDDCYEYMRELYKLVMASQEYSQIGQQKINPKTYTYIYLQDSILYYDDAQTQAIYWQELLGQRGAMDTITKDEVESMRTRDPVLKWQVLEYEKYDECNGKVYALNPFGSAYVRAYMQLALDKGLDNLVDGAYEAGSHEGADLMGRNIIDSMLNKKSVSEQGMSIASKVYDYSLNQLEKVYNSKDKAKEYLQADLLEQSSYMPIVAVAPGVVESVGFNGRSGFNVTIIHDNSETVRTLYCHLKRWPNVNEGDHVGAGTVIGYEGNTGRSGGTHLHFQIMMANAGTATGTVDPEDYIYPTFTPFFYYEKAKENNFNISNEYMTLYRTVFLMDENNPGNKETGGTFEKNSTPRKALLNDYNNLKQEQGKRERALQMSGSLGWAEKEISDIYLREEYLDINKAREAGLLKIDSELLNVSYGYIPVKTDMPGALPALTREELEYILQNWLSNRYNEDEFNWLMKNVFTAETITKIIEAQNEYKVSAVFALAVGTLEQQLGLSYYREPESKILGSPENCNIFSIKGSGVIYQNGGHWNKYDSYGEAFAGFSRLIAGGNYFGAGRFTIAAIGPTYCPTGTPPGASWTGQVTTLVYQILQYYKGDKWSSNIQFVDNSEFLGIARNFITLLSNKGYSYGYSRTNFDPFTNTITSKTSQIDCTAFVSGVIRAYAEVHGISELKDFNEGSEGFCSFANKVANGSEKNFSVVWIRQNRNLNKPDGSHPTLEWLQQNMLPGDIIVFFAGKRASDRGVYYPDGTKGAHHAEIFAGDWKGSSYSAYSCGSAPAGKYNDGEPVWHKCFSTAGKNGNTRYTLYAILRLNSNGN